MTTALVNVIALNFIAAMLAVVMVVAWRSFGRPRHALIWATAFSLATGEWIANPLMGLFANGDAFHHAVILGLSGLSNALIAIGFVQRSHMRSLTPTPTPMWAGLVPLLLTAAGAAALIFAAGLLLSHRGISDAIGLYFAGAMAVISAARVARSFKAASLPERATLVMLLLLAAIDVGLGTGALGHGASGDGDIYRLFRIPLVLFYPLAFIGLGPFLVLLVAADRAENMRLLATSDELTGIYNRRGFEESAERAIRNAQRQRQPLAVVVADIDNFKTINDRYGHSTGDRALKHFTSRLDRLIRRGDLIGRIGGEEFAMLLVNTRAQDAIEVVERIRRDIAVMPVDGRTRIVMTASFGVTGLRPGDISLAALLSRADRALYRSKIEGRDRVTSAEGLDDGI